VKWVIPRVLARAQRPGYRGELRHHVPLADVDAWIAEAKDLGIKSIVCLLTSEELAYYDVDLLTQYLAAGFAVEHIPIEDYKRPPLTASQLQMVDIAFQRAVKPVVMHCSAGFGRSRMAIEYICKSLDTNSK
jgi:protein-tyrosine phosphatase